MDEINMISASILIEGGAPRLATLRINHQRVKEGNRFISPFKRKRFRVWDVS